MDSTFVDDFHTVPNRDRMIRHGRRADYAAPPWAQLMQAEADRADIALEARDIARGAYENVVGPHVQTHRSEKS